MPTVIREFARAGAGEVSAVASGAFSSGKLLTAVRNGSDNLELIVWAPDAANRSLARRRDSGTQAGEVGGIALAMMGERCVTAVQNGDGKLLLIPWAHELIDDTISRLEVADNQAGKASYIAIMPLSDSMLNDSVLVTPCRNGAGNLLIIPWSLNANGHIGRLDFGMGQGGSVADGSTTYEPFSNQEAVSVPLAGAMIAGAAIDESDFVTAKINKWGGLELAAWALNASNQPTPWWTSPVLEELADNLCMAPLGDPGPERNFVLAYRRITPVLGANVVTFRREVIVSVWAASTASGSVTEIAQATVGGLEEFSLTVGSIAPAGRQLIFLSGHSGDNLLVNVAFEVIADASGLALILTGHLHDDSFRNIGEFAPVSLANGQFATSLRNDDGIGLVAYNLSDLSATLVRPLAEATSDEATSIRVRALNPDQAIVALRNASGNLELIGWDVAAADFAVARAADVAADTSGHPIAASDVALVVRGEQAVTAIQAGSGHLRLDSWNVAADLSSISWVHETGTAAGGADLITATLLEPDLVVTAVRNLSGNLLLIVWRIETDGTLSRLNHENAQAGEIDLIALTALDASNVATAVRDGSGNLLVIGWSIGSDGTVERWSQDGHAGEVREIAAVALDGADSSKNIVTAVRDGSDGLLVIVWRASVDDRSITRLTDSGDQGHGDGDATQISVCVCPSPASLRPTIVTSRRRGGGSLKLSAWQLLDDASGVPVLIETGDMTNRADLDFALTDICTLEPGRVAVAANVGMKHSSGLWLSTMKVSDAVMPAAPANILTLGGFINPPPPAGSDWANGDGTYPGDKPFEWEQVLDATNEYDDAPIGVSGWVVKPEESGGDVPFSHPFGFDWELGIAVEKGFESFVSPANRNEEEEKGNPNANGIALADQLGLVRPLGLLGLEWEKDLLPQSYRGQVNHGDRVAALGRWILDNGHNLRGQFRTEIHPPLLLASANVVQPADGVPRTRALFISRPYLSGQTYTTNLDTRYQDGVDDDGALFNPTYSSHGFNELIKVLTFRSTLIEMHSKIKEKPFRGNHSATFTVRPPGPRPSRDAQLLVSYRFNVRTPCQVRLQLSPAPARDGVEVIVDLLEQSRDGRAYQAPALPNNQSENYNTDQLDLLSAGSGDRIAFGEGLIEIASLIFISGLYALYLRAIFENGIETDAFDAQSQFDILDPTGGVKDVSAGQIVPGAGIIEGDSLVYPITGWVEAYWGGHVN
jgi:hypothetical protein